jgi:hypothetical protein
MKGHIGDHDARREQQRQAQPDRHLVVQKILPPALGHKLRHHNSDDLISLPVPCHLFDVLQQRLDDLTIGRLKDDEADPLAPLLPMLAHLLGFRGVDGDVHRCDVLREQAGIMQGGPCPLVHPRDRHQDTMAPTAPRGLCGPDRELLVEVAVVMMDGKEALSWQQMLTGTNALPLYPHVYLQNKGWLDARPVVPSCTKCERHAMVTIHEEAERVLKVLQSHASDAPCDELEAAVWNEVDFYHQNGGAYDVRTCAVSCYQALDDQLTVAFLAKQIARVVAEYREKPRMAVMN